MYDNVVYMGKTLKKWRELMFNVYTLGELYQMSREKVNFQDMCKTV